MKKLNILVAIGIGAAVLTGCDDFLNDNRYPLSQQVSSPAFWSNPNNVQGQINRFYEEFSGYGNGSGSGKFYFSYLSDDQANATSSATIKPWDNTSVPSSSALWNDSYTIIRGANLIIEGVESSSLTESEKTNFTAIARLMRGYKYYLLVRAFGDVPLVKKALDPSDQAELFGARTPRNEVMDYALEDLSFAVDNIATKASKITFSADLAAAIKSEVCLFEASYAKYHKNDNSRANKFFNEVVNATEPLLAKYPIGKNYQATYNSFRAELTANPEIIFMKAYEKDVLMHCTVDYTSSSSPVAGMTKDAFDAYLFKDGKPLALTSENKSDVGVVYPRLGADGKQLTEKKGDEEILLWNYSIKDALSVRDARLVQTVDTAVYYAGLQYQRPNSMLMTSLTGYGICKFNNLNMPEEFTTTIKNYTCAPLYWGAGVAMDYIEAKAELGTITDADVDKTINKLFERAELPATTVAKMTEMNDPANNMNISSLLWEIRRCRRCEFIFDGNRYWDLIRWHQLELLDNVKYPNVGLGANISASPVSADNVNGYYNAANGGIREFEERQYLYPIPSGQIQLNEQLTQNPGW